MSSFSGTALSGFAHVLQTIKNVTPWKYEHVITERDFPLFKELYGRKSEYFGGTQIEIQWVLQGSKPARYVLPGEPCPISNVDGMQTGQVGWAILNENMHWEEREFNAAMAKMAATSRSKKELAIKVQDYYQSKREQNLIIPTLQNLENAVFAVPQDTNDQRRPFGIPAWVCLANAGVTGFGFNGQTIRYSGGTTSAIMAGQDRSTTANQLLRNATSVYTKIDSGIIDKLREMKLKLGFKRPPMTKGVEGASGSDYVIYCGDDVYLDLQSVADSRFESRRSDLSNADGMLNFEGIPIQNIPALTYSASDNLTKYRPIYFINKRTLGVCVAAGEWMRETDPVPYSAERHRTMVVQMDTQFQFFCKNPRQNGVLHLVTA